MITAADSNVLLDVFGRDPTYGPASADALRAALASGRLIACEVVWAEVAAPFATAVAAREACTRLNLEFSPLAVEDALDAGLAWKAYRDRGGPRTGVTADFLIGAHALHNADQLLTRDRGFYRSFFKNLSIVEPQTNRR